jgi:hypothetical protein
MAPDFDEFFSRYVAAYNRSLGGKVDVDGIRSHFTESFLAAGPGTVRCGKNNWLFSLVLKRGYAYYKKIGTRRLAVRRVEVTPIDELHHLARVFYTGDFEKKSGEQIHIDFEVSYLLQTREGGPKIFAFIAGDEEAAYREKGLLD